MNFDEASGWLIVGLINDHFPHPDEVEEDPQLGTDGCVINCGPCGALKWLLDHDRAGTEYRIKLTGFHLDGGWCYWERYTNVLRWDWFEEYWAGHKGCATDGDPVTVTCDFGDDDLGIPS